VCASGAVRRTLCTGTDAGTDSTAGTESGSGEVTAPANDVVYLVQAGDTLGKIAERYNVSIDAIVQANNLPNADQISAGQSLVIPVSGSAAGDSGAGATADTDGTAEQTHIVQAGENLFRIGLRYGFTVEAVGSYNNITYPYTIYVGQTIRIPPSQ